MNFSIMCKKLLLGVNRSTKVTSYFSLKVLGYTCVLSRLGLPDQGQGDWKYPSIMRHP